CETPVAATLSLTTEHGADVVMAMDFLQAGPPSWDIDIETDQGRLLVSKGGAVLRIDDQVPDEKPDNEYANLYARFGQLVRNRDVDVDVTPFRLVADAFMLGRRSVVEPFVE